MRPSVFDLLALLPLARSWQMLSLKVQTVDTVVGISIRGAFAHEVAQSLDIEVAIHRNVDGEPDCALLQQIRPSRWRQESRHH